jgi:FixJ family two-component response regulator
MGRRRPTRHVSSPPPLVHLVDDDTTLRQAARELLTRAGYEVRCYGDAHQFLDEFRPRSPQCVVLDVFLPLLSGLELQRRLLDPHPGLPIILMSGSASPKTVIQALRQGARDFLEKPWMPEELLDAVGRAIETDRRRGVEVRANALAAEKLDALSTREREILELIAAGHSSKSAAVQLGVAKRTIDFHRGNLMRKLDVDSVAELVRLALAAGIVPRADPDRTRRPA